MSKNELTGSSDTIPNEPGLPELKELAYAILDEIDKYPEGLEAYIRAIKIPKGMGLVEYDKCCERRVQFFNALKSSLPQDAAPLEDVLSPPNRELIDSIEYNTPYLEDLIGKLWRVLRIVRLSQSPGNDIKVSGESALIKIPSRKIDDVGPEKARRLKSKTQVSAENICFKEVGLRGVKNIADKIEHGVRFNFIEGFEDLQKRALGSRLKVTSLLLFGG